MSQKQTTTQQNQKRLQKIIKIINISTALLLVVLSVLSFIFVIIAALASFKFFLIFSPFFMIMFGLILLAAEFKIKWVLKKVSFLKSLLGRSLFNIYLSSVIYYYFESCDQIFLAWVSAIALFVVGVIYLLLYFGYNFVSKDKQVLANQDDSDGYKQRLM